MNYFVILEFMEDMLDIREQFPLELEETLLIAEKLYTDGSTIYLIPAAEDPIVVLGEHAEAEYRDEFTRSLRDYIQNRALKSDCSMVPQLVVKGIFRKKL